MGHPAHTLLPENRHGRPANAEMAHEEEQVRRVRIYVVLTVLTLATHGARAASTPPALLCVRQAQVDLKACQTLAHEAGGQCTTNYFTAVPPCFGANAPCASECITTRTSCETGPKDRQTTCAAACDARATRLQAACKGRQGHAAQLCLLKAKLDSLKCKQKCARATVIPLQRCTLDFSSCLKSCATRSGS